MTLTRRLTSLKARSIRFGSPNMFPAAGRMAQYSEAMVQVLQQAIPLGPGRSNGIPAEPTRPGLGFHHVQGIIDAIQLGFEQRPFRLGHLAFRLAIFMEKTTLMIAVRKNGTNGGRSSPGSHRRLPATPLGGPIRDGPVGSAGIPKPAGTPVALDKPRNSRSPASVHQSHTGPLPVPDASRRTLK